MSLQNHNRKEFTPRNEQGVFYLFSRNREKLGFKEIVKINQREPPDIIATKDNGEQVGIELEYETKRVLEHYFVLSERNRNRTEKRQDWDTQAKKYVCGRWSRVGKVWNFVHKGETLHSKKENYPNQYWLDESRNTLLHSTVKDKGINIIMYWIKNILPDDFKPWEFDKCVEYIDLRETLSKIKDPILF